jgi:hypothetical protein
MTTTHKHLSQPVHCVIKVRGRLDSNWVDYFENLTLTLDDEFTLISGIVDDQAALHGILTRIRDLGLPLNLVECSECEKPG